jgi:predicted Rossmann fold flavoprotein
MAAACGHTIIKPRPALVPVTIKQKWLRELKGISLDHTQLKLTKNGKRIAAESGELLFTHFGLSGPAILRISRNLPDFSLQSRDTEANWQLKINLVSDKKHEDLINLWRDQIAQNQGRTIVNALSRPFPSKLTNELLNLAGIDPTIRAADVSNTQLDNLAMTCRNLLLDIEGTRGYREAMVTAGGVSLKEIDPRTMQSKLVRGLYFAGEVMDIDGDTGGYNLQAAFSTGVLAGRHAAAD